MLLHADTVKSSNFFQGKPSDEANQINEGMVKTFMTFTKVNDQQLEEIMGSDKDIGKNKSSYQTEEHKTAAYMNNKLDEETKV